MSDINRFLLEYSDRYSDSCQCNMVDSPHGAYVLYDDHLEIIQRLQADLEIKTLENIKGASVLDECREKAKQLQAQLEKLRKHISQLENVHQEKLDLEERTARLEMAIAKEALEKSE